MIVFSQPYHVANVDILGTYTLKAVCVKEQKRAMAIGTGPTTSFGCVKIEGVKRTNVAIPRVKDKGLQ